MPVDPSIVAGKVERGTISARSGHVLSILSGLETATRSLIAAALPIQIQALFGTDEAFSALFLCGAVSAVSIALFLPSLSLRLGRVRLCAIGITLLASSSVLFMLDFLSVQVLGFVVRAIGSAIFNAVLAMYIMDRVKRSNIGRSEPLRYFYVGVAWTIGPFLGIYLSELGGDWAAFAASALAALLLLVLFLMAGLDAPGRLHSNAALLAKVSVSQLSAYVRQPRLVLAWLQGSGRILYWSTVNFYLPLFAVQTGLGASVGGFLVGLSSVFVFGMPIWGWIARQFGIRRVSLVCFPVASIAMVAGGLLSSTPWVAAALFTIASLFMSAVDGYGNALFLRACKPFQRTAMSPIFSSYRDVTNVAQAALFAVLLIFFPIQAVFIAAGIAMGGLALLAFWINPRL